MEGSQKRIKQSERKLQELYAQRADLDLQIASLEKEVNAHYQIRVDWESLKKFWRNFDNWKPYHGGFHCFGCYSSTDLYHFDTADRRFVGFQSFVSCKKCHKSVIKDRISAFDSSSTWGEQTYLIDTREHKIKQRKE